MKKCLLSLLILSLGLTPTFAAVDIFLKLEDGASGTTLVRGESLDAVHKDEIEVLAWSWGMSNSGSTHTGGGAGAGKANFQDLSVTKYVDRSSVELMKGVATGKHFPTATLYVRKAGQEASQYYLKITMSEVLVSSLSTGGSGGETRLTENVSLNFAKFEVEYVQFDPKTGKELRTLRFAYDIAGNLPQ